MSDPLESDPTANAVYRLVSETWTSAEEVARLRRELAEAEESIQVLGMLLTEAKLEIKRLKAECQCKPQEVPS